MRKNILAIIPARGGSKGIPRKNIVDLCGKPLIQYTIEPALSLLKEKFICRVIISTDDQEIAEISRNMGVEVPFVRPLSLADDKSKSVDVVLHAVEYFENLGESYDSVLLLQPTSPLRSVDDIKAAINIFDKNDNESLISVFKEHQYNELILYYEKKGYAVPFSKWHNEGTRRQEHKDVYVRNGAIYITQTTYLKKSKRIISDLPLLYEMPKERSANIDTREDLEYIKWLLCR